MTLGRHPRAAFLAACAVLACLIPVGIGSEIPTLQELLNQVILQRDDGASTPSISGWLLTRSTVFRCSCRSSNGGPAFGPYHAA